MVTLLSCVKVQVAMGEFFFRQLQTFSIDVAETLCEALDMTKRLPGIYLEIGVYKAVVGL